MLEKAWIVAEVFIYWLLAKEAGEVWIPGGDGGTIPIQPPTTPLFISHMPPMIHSDN